MAETEQEKTEETLKKLIDLLRDSHQGFSEIGKHLKDERSRLFFLEETLVRADFAGELENELHRLGVKDVKQSGLVAGKVHRAWGELKAKLGAGDHALLATAEAGEDAAKDAYEKALKEHLPGDIRDLLLRQFEHIRTSHDVVKKFRDDKAA